MSIRAWISFGISALVLTLGGLGMYWAHEPLPSFDGYPVDVVTQKYGSTSILKVPQVDVLGEDEFSIYSTVIDLEGRVIFATPSVYINKKNNSYAAVTYKNLPIGNYNVVVHVDRQLNPIRFVRQQFTLATLSVIGAPDVANDPTAKFICPRYPSGRTGQSVPVPNGNPDPFLYNGA